MVDVNFQNTVIAVDVGESTGAASVFAAAAAASADAAEGFADDAAASAAAAAAIANYFPTRAGGAAATATDNLFSSDEEGAMAVYRRTAAPPNYTRLHYVLTKEALAASSGGTLVGLAAGTAAQALPASDIRFEQATVVAGETSSTDKMIAALIALRAAGGGTARGTPGVTYKVGLVTPTLLGGTMGFGGAADFSAGWHFMVPSVDDLHVDFNGATLQQTVNSSSAVALIMGSVLYEVTGAMAAGATTYTFATAGDAADFTAGDRVCWRLGDVPGDAVETANWGFAKVASVDTGANTVTLDRPLSRPWDGTGTNSNEHLWRCEVGADQVIDDIRVVDLAVSGVAANSALTTFGAIRPHFPRLVARNQRIGAGLQMTENAELGFWTIEDSLGSGPDNNQGLRLSQASARCAHLVTRNIARSAVVLEGGSDLFVDYHEDFSYAPDASRTVLTVGYGSRLHIHRARFVGKAPASGVIAGGDATASLRIDHFRLEYDAMPPGCPAPGRQVGVLSLCLGGVEELYDAARITVHRQFFELVDDAEPNAYAPPGCVVGCRVYLGGGAVKADFDAFYVGHDGFAWSDVQALLPAAASAVPTDVSTASAYVDFGAGSSNFTKRHDPAQAYLVCKATGLTGTGKFAVVEWEIVADQLAGAGTWSGDYHAKGWIGVTRPIRVTTANRPAAPLSGERVFDLTLDADGKAIDRIAAQWVDATGTPV